jgi:DNA-3-methyladenine glycosylase
MHCCFNVVANQPDQPEAILVRALEPVDGVELMIGNRKTESIGDLCNGPGKLCAALGITVRDYGDDLCGNRLYIEDAPLLPKERIMVSPRINIDYAEECRDYLWRYFVKDCPYVSKVSKRYRLMERSMI